MRSLSVGIDSIEIDRIAKSIEREGFMERVYSAKEIAMFKERDMRAETIAANFAIKEAFSKALGTGVAGFSLNEVSTLRDEKGAPYIELSGAAYELAKDLSLSVSITHTRTHATAIVIAY